VGLARRFETFPECAECLVGIVLWGSGMWKSEGNDQKTF